MTWNVALPISMPICLMVMIFLHWLKSTYLSAKEEANHPIRRGTGRPEERPRPALGKDRKPLAPAGRPALSQRLSIWRYLSPAWHRRRRHAAQGQHARHADAFCALGRHLGRWLRRLEPAHRTASNNCVNRHEALGPCRSVITVAGTSSSKESSSTRWHSCKILSPDPKRILDIFIVLNSKR